MIITPQDRGRRSDGTLVALDAETVIESGAFSGAVLAVSAVFLGSMYKWPAFDIRGFEVLTHKPSVAAYRAPVAPQTIFAIESHMEQIARTLEPRSRRVPSPPPDPGRRPDGERPALAEQWRQAGAGARRRSTRSGQSGRPGPESGNRDGHGLRGTGLAVGGWLGGLQPTGATVRLNPDGSLSVLTGQVDIAGTNIALAQIAASAYGVDIEKVRITTGDTDVAPVTGLSAGSKTIYTVGVAVMEAAKDARGSRRLEIAAKELEASIHDLDIEDGKVVVRGVPDRSITLASIGKKGNLYMSKIEPVLGVAHPAFSQQAPGFAAQLARIEVDPDTGEAHAPRLRGRPGRGARHQSRSAWRARCRAAPSRASAWRSPRR